MIYRVGQKTNRNSKGRKKRLSIPQTQFAGPACSALLLFRPRFVACHTESSRPRAHRDILYDERALAWDLLRVAFGKQQQQQQQQLETPGTVRNELINETELFPWFIPLSTNYLLVRLSPRPVMVRGLFVYTQKQKLWHSRQQQLMLL